MKEVTVKPGLGAQSLNLLFDKADNYGFENKPQDNETVWQSDSFGNSFYWDENGDYHYFDIYGDSWFKDSYTDEWYGKNDKESWYYNNYGYQQHADVSGNKWVKDQEGTEFFYSAKGDLTITFKTGY